MKMTKNIFKRVLSIVLCVAMLVTTMSFVLTASAADVTINAWSGLGITAESEVNNHGHKSEPIVSDTSIQTSGDAWTTGKTYVSYVGYNGTQTFNLEGGFTFSFTMGDANYWRSTNPVGGGLAYNEQPYSYVKIGDLYIASVRGLGDKDTHSNKTADNVFAVPGTVYIVKANDEGTV